MIDFSSFYQKSGESWADMMDEEAEDEETIEKSNNKSCSSDSHDATDNSNRQNLNETTTDVSINEKEKDKTDVEEKADEDNKNDKIDKLKEYYENIESTIKRIEASATTKRTAEKGSGGHGRGVNGGIVWRLPNEDQKKQQQDVIQRLVRQRQNIDTEDNWRKKPQKEIEEKTAWRSSKPYRAPEKNNSKQWHAYSEELQLEYEEQVEENRKEFQRKFGTKSTSNVDDKTEPKKTSEPSSPLKDVVKPSILISADGPSDWADDIPTSEEEEEEEVEIVVEEEEITEQLTSEFKQELSPDPAAFSPNYSDRSINASTLQSSASEHSDTQSPQENADPITTTMPTSVQPKKPAHDPSAWISFAEQNSSNSPALSTTTSITTTTKEEQQAELEKDEQAKSGQLEEAEEPKFVESKEYSKDEPQDTKPAIQENNVSGWNTFAKQSTSKWATTTKPNNEVSSEHGEDNSGATLTQEHQQKEKQQEAHLNPEVDDRPQQATSGSTASNDDRNKRKPNDFVMQSPRKQILDHLFKNTNTNKGKIRQQTVSPPSVVSESNTIPHHDSDDNTKPWSTFADQHHKQRTLSDGLKMEGDVKNYTSQQSNEPSTKYNNDDNWRAGATWDTSSTAQNMDEDDAKSRSSWKNSNIKSSDMNKNNTEGGGASAAWTAIAASNDDDIRSHSSRKTDNSKPRKEDNDAWRGAGAMWTHITATNSISEVDDDVKSHTSRTSHTSRRSASRSHSGNENERASAAWIAAGVQIRAPHSDNTRRKYETRQSSGERGNGRHGSATWNTSGTMDNDDGKSHSSKSTVKNENGSVSNIWNSSITETPSTPIGSESVSHSNISNIVHGNVNPTNGDYDWRTSASWMNADSTTKSDSVTDNTSSKPENDINQEREKTADSSNESKWQVYARERSSANGNREMHRRDHHNNQRPWS